MLSTHRALSLLIASGLCLGSSHALAQAADPPKPAADPPTAADAPRPDPKAGDAAAPVTKPADGRSLDAARGTVGAKPGQVYAEDWWSRTRPVFEIHGYFRVRAELFHNFALSRDDPPETSYWARPLDYGYKDSQGNQQAVDLCGPLDGVKTRCENRTQSSANLRFRLNPELHISDNLRILSQIDLLDNVVMGSTPNGYYLEKGGTQVGQPNGYAPRGAFSNTIEAPTAGQNSLQNSVVVKRVWGEYKTPVGLLRFGRQPSHWGLGVLANSGDTYDSDWQTTADRIMFITGVPSLDLYVGGAWDFPNEGAISARPYEIQGQPYDLGQLDDVNQYVLVLVRRRAPEKAKQDLAEGRAVVNGGMYVVYRNQYLANDNFSDPARDNHPGQSSGNLKSGLVRRSAEAIIPDAWFQFQYRKFRFEAEGAMIRGSMSNTAVNGDDYLGAPFQPKGWKLRQYFIATESELKAVEDRLRVKFGFGWASGDADLQDGSIAPTSLQLQPQRSYDRTFSMARFHPNYRVDLILFRNILTRVQGAYYFRPSVDYDFMRSLNGQKFGGGAAVIWSRASEFVQAPGHKRDLGLELDFTLYYQSKDGALNDDPDKMGGFYTMLQYGVLFPLGGLGYMDREVADTQRTYNVSLDTGTAQVIRWYTGILFLPTRGRIRQRARWRGSRARRTCVRLRAANARHRIPLAARTAGRW